MRSVLQLEGFECPRARYSVLFRPNIFNFRRLGRMTHCFCGVSPVGRSAWSVMCPAFETYIGRLSGLVWTIFVSLHQFERPPTVVVSA